MTQSSDPARGDTNLTDLVARYDELVLEGEAPDADTFCASYPELPELRDRIRDLERLRGELGRILGPAGGERRLESVPDIPGFRVIKPIGSGGMGTVFLAQQDAPRRLCALKLVTATYPAAAERFRREADLAARLSHPNVATVYTFGVQGTQPYLATEFVHGFSLRNLLHAADLVTHEDSNEWFVDTMRRLSEGAVQSKSPAARAPVIPMVRLATQVADALAHAHQRGVIHRDVKPSNVIVGLNGQAKLIDFGIAVTSENSEERFTRTGTFIGSHEYAAPEQLRGEHDKIGPWTDTYALGATLYEMLTQRTPFNCATFADRLALVDEVPEMGPRAINPKVSPDLDALVMRALQPEPGQRFHDGEEIAEALRAARTRPSILPRFPAKWVGWMWPRSFWQGASYVLLGALVALGTTYNTTREEYALLRARTVAQEMMTGRALLDKALEDDTQSIQRCLLEDPRATPPTKAPRFIADVTVSKGRVTAVKTSKDSFNLGTRSRRCIERRIEGFLLPGVGLVDEQVLSVDVRVVPESLPW